MSIMQVSIMQVIPSSLFKAYVKKLAIIIATFTLVLLAWGNAFSCASANAATIDGVTDRVEGKIEKGIGTIERNKGDLLDNPRMEAEGGLKELKGSTKDTLGSAKNSLDDAKDTVENKSESIIDSVKDFFE